MLALGHLRHTWQAGPRAAGSEPDDSSDQQRTGTNRRFAAWCTAAGAAWAAALVWLIRLPSFFVLGQSSSSLVSREVSALLGVTPHLLLFPVVAALSAPRWARQAAYSWLVIDVATDVMALNGVPKTTYLALRYGGHVAAALWIAAAAWQAAGGTRIVGLLLALNLGAYSFLAPLDPTHFVGLLPMMVLLPLWLAFVGRDLRGTTAAKSASVAITQRPSV